MTEQLRVAVGDDNIIIVVKRVDYNWYEAFTEPHPIVAGFGTTGYAAIEDMVGRFHEEYTRMKMMDKAGALPMTQKGTLALMKKFSEFF